MTKELAKQAPAEHDWEAAFLKSLGTPEERMERKKRMDAALDFMFGHMDEWRELYPNHWIAVYGAKLIAAESSWKRLVRRVNEDGYDLRHVLTRFITEEPLFLLRPR